MRPRAQRCGVLPLSLLLAACGPSAGEDSSSGGSGTSNPTTSTGMVSATTLPADGTESTTVDPGTTSAATGSTGSTGNPIPDVSDGGTLDCEPVWAVQGCVPPLADGGIMATTPLGGFALDHSVFGAHTGCGGCVDSPNIYSLVFAADPGLFSDLTPGLGVDETLTVQFVLAPFEGPLGRPVMAEMTANRDGSSEQTMEALVTFDDFPTIEDLGEPYGPETVATVAGSVTVEAEGWTVQGEFVATYCPDINEFALCE